MKKAISLFIMIIILLSLAPQAFASRNTQQEEVLAQHLKSLGVFRGVSDSEFDLGRAPTRVEALVMLIRLLGKEAEAQNGSYTHPFCDVPAWADGYVGYAYENGLTNGVSATEFGTEDANIQMYLTFSLRSLGYFEKYQDFSYDEPFSLAYQTGILPAMVDRENFLRADCVTISYVSLSAYIKNSETTLATKLIGDGVFTEADFLRYYDKNAVNYSGETKKELSAEEIYKKCSPAVFYIEVFDKNNSLLGSGSGFFIDADGTAVTNFHVIDGVATAKVTTTSSQEVYDVEGVYDFSQENDWAVIKVSGSGFDALKIGDEATVVGGATVYAIGSPMGLQNTISQGLISNTNRVLDGVTYIQTSAAISKGSSGGALINKYGEVIGITSAGFTDGENLGLAIPVSALDGFKKAEIDSIKDVNKKQNQTSTKQMSAQDALKSFIATYCNRTLEGRPAFLQITSGEAGFIDMYALLENDGSVRILIWEDYGFDTYYFTVSLTGDNAGAMYYDYRSGNGLYYYSGEAKTAPESFEREKTISLKKIKGNTDQNNANVIASDYMAKGLDFINSIYAWIADAVGEHTVAELGYTSFK